MKSPFKFLDAYEKKDHEFFFGRQEDVEQLYELAHQSNLLLVYGQSGTGKTSLIQCGLANRFLATDWFDLYIRRQDNINEALLREIGKAARTPIKPGVPLPKALHSLYLDFLKPVYLIFDQFEELFILGSPQEQQAFIQTIAALLQSEMNCRLIFVIREEYLAMLHKFEKAVPTLFSKRFRVEPMSLHNVKEVIIRTTDAFHIQLEKGKDERGDDIDIAQQIIDNLKEDRSARVQLSYLQVYLDKLYRKAVENDSESASLNTPIIFSKRLVQQTGTLDDVMADFLEEQIAAIQKEFEPEHFESVAFSSDGKSLASGSNDQAIGLWDIDKRQEIARLKGHSGDVRSVAYSPDGKILASGSMDSTVRLWDIDKCREIACLDGHSGHVYYVTFNNNGKILASGSWDQTIRLWDIDKRKEIARLEGNSGRVFSIDFSSNGKILASGTDGPIIRLWDIDKHQENARLEGNSGGVRSVAFSSDGKLLASGSEDHTISLWDIAERKELARLEGHSGGVNSLAFSSDGKTLASGSGDNTIRLWDIAQRKEFARLEGHFSVVTSVIFSPDGKILASGSHDNTIRLLDIVERKEIARLEGHGYPNVSPKSVLLILEEFATLEGTKKPMTKKELTANLQLPHRLINACLVALENRRILRHNEDVYELAHDTLARHIAEKRTAEKKNLLMLQKLVKDGYAAYKEFGSYLTPDEVKRVTPFLNKLDLTKDEINFVSQCNASTEQTPTLREITKVRSTGLQLYTPVIFLAFANDLDVTGQFLRNVIFEQRGIREALEQAIQAGVCELVERVNATIGDILKVFQQYRDRIAIFHYGGHANSYELLLESLIGEHAVDPSEGLVSFLAKQKGLQLIFLNGCCSKQQALDLVEAGLPAVIGTSQAINDAVATGLSVRFYRGLAAGRTIDRAWAEAVDLVTMEKSPDWRALFWKGETGITENFPWDIYYRDGAKKVKEWNLSAAANNPLFGLPEISEDYYRKLPNTPFIWLQYFKKEDAAIFFGRGTQIRKLYDHITGIHPLILFYGESGVGKSSLLNAGLLPRLERYYAVQYIRRDAKKGLTNTLLQTLQNIRAVPGLPDADSAGNAEANPILETWCQIEVETGHPLIIILDQVEETFTQPLSGGEESRGELEDFLEIIKQVFDQPGKRPQGKLILSYRKEYHPEINDGFHKLLLPYAGVFLQQLDRNGIIEAVEGLTKHPATREKYRLEIEKGADGNLAEIIAGDLLADKKSPIAPMLQLVLTKLWDIAVQENSEAPRFTVARYQQLQKEGIAMYDFLQQQMEHLRQLQPELVESGLVLDLLHAHTTALGTAGTCAMDELQQNYSHRQDILDELIVKCQTLYLLTKIQRLQNRYTRLAHDLLAPVVRSAYHDSDKPGQRAARVLSSKLSNFKAYEALLDEADLAVVEIGRSGMRQLTNLEQSLVTRSQEKQSRRRQQVQEMMEKLKYPDDEVTKRLQELGYYDSSKNPNGKGIKHQYKHVKRKGKKLVVDHVTGLTWQQSGSQETMNHADAEKYIRELNDQKFAGFNDWRLPTLEEAMSLMEPKKKMSNLYIDPVFERKQNWIWTADRVRAGFAWAVYFDYGGCNSSPVVFNAFVRAVC